MYITPRTLLGIIRLSQAMAKLHLREEVVQTDVDEAIKLMDYSIKSLNTDNSKIKKGNKKQDQMSDIIGKIREFVESKSGTTVDIADVNKALSKKFGQQFSKQALEQTLEHYKKLNVVYVDNEDRIYFV